MLKKHAFDSSTPTQGYGGSFMSTVVSTQCCGGPQISLVTALVHHFAQPAHPERDRKGDAEMDERATAPEQFLRSAAAP